MSNLQTVVLKGGPADGASIALTPGWPCCGFVVVMQPDGLGWCFDDDVAPPANTGTRYLYDLNGVLVEVQRIRG